MQLVDIWGFLPWWLHPDFLTPVSVAVTMAATLIIALATVINLHVSSKMAKAAKDSADAAKLSADMAEKATRITESVFESSHRPYLGISNVVTIADGFLLILQCEVKNFGAVPLECFKWDLDLLVSGERQSVDPKGGNCFVLPGGKLWFPCVLSKFTSQTLRTNPTSVEVNVHCRYRSVATGKEYEYRCRHQALSSTDFSILDSWMD